MLPGLKAGFALDARLEADSEQLMWLGLCELRVMNDRRWPWLILVPQRPGHRGNPRPDAARPGDADLRDQHGRAGAEDASPAAPRSTPRALGNIVRQLHVHVVARSEGDPGWPGPVWGHGMREPYKARTFAGLPQKIKAAL